MLVTYRRNWGEERVYYHDAVGTLCYMPVEWTNLAPIDPFIRFSAGRAAFRLVDLLELSRLLAALTRKEDC